MSAKIAVALHEIMSKVGYVQKTGKNAFHNYKYAGEADLLDKLRPAMVEAGLMLLPSVKSVTPVDEHGNVTVMMEYTLIHKDGEVWPEKIGAAGMGNDRGSKGGVGDKGVYKAITGANKYVLFKLFQIETGDDPEIDSPHEGAPKLRDNLKTNKQTGRTSSSSLKQDKSPDNWDAFIQELTECRSVSDLTKLALSWSHISERDVWPAAWHTLAKNKINERREELVNGVVPDDGDDFPGDRPNAYVDNMRAG